MPSINRLSCKSKSGSESALRGKENKGIDALLSLDRCWTLEESGTALVRKVKNEDS